jgi:hypothetical protein
MLGQILNGEQLETARGFQDDLKKERDVSLLDILRFPMRMPEACSKETMGAFLSGMYSLMGNSSEINSRNKDATERETRYLRMCLSNADIQEIRNKLEPVQEMYVKALISGAPVTTLKSIVNYLEHSANVLYAKYKYMQDLAEGIEGTSEAKYFALARENNGRGNDACPIQTNSVSEASIVLVEGGEFAIVDGERIHNPLIPCPDKACNKLFRVYDNGKRHKTCPHCGWDPCDPEKTGATYKSRLLLENKMKQSGLKEVRIIEPEVIIAPLKRRIEPESDVKPVVHSTDNLKRFRYVAELDMYYEIIFGQVYYFSPRQLQERSGIEAMNFV